MRFFLSIVSIAVALAASPARAADLTISAAASLQDALTELETAYEAKSKDALKGNLKDTDALIRAMRKADFNSIRGKFTFNSNNHPIQNFYLLKAVAGPAGQDPVMEIQKTVFTNHKDAYAGECKLKW